MERISSGRDGDRGARLVFGSGAHDALRRYQWVLRVTRSSGSLYSRLLGPAWAQLAEPLHVLHGSSAVRAHGRFRVERGRHPVAALVAGLMRLPRTAAAVDTRLVITRGDDVELWSRTFDNRRLETRQYVVGDAVLAERFGAIEYRFRLEASDGSLLFHQVGAALMVGSLRMRLPAICAPAIDAREGPVSARRVAVSVRIDVPAGGRVLSYDGVIDIEESPA
ncbi:MAG: DUF4166 domain-containing protein [Acidobacteria bacterium]|nr:MAG: DUF4166 domain-containing protein [Acidobacteriota bacterium]